MSLSNYPEIPALIHQPGGNHRRVLSIRALITLVMVLYLSPLTSRGQAAKPGEYGVKAVYLYNFGKFISWPEASSKDESFTICVLGADPFGSVLDVTVAGEAIDNRKLIVKRIMNSRDATACRILFISTSEASHIKEILASVEKSSVLTVSDIPDFSRAGGMIQFVIKDNKVRFNVNLATAEKAGLTFSSQLLRVAAEVTPGSQSGGANP